MKILSLFDGMSCGQIALNRLGVPIDEYYASEIDKFAMQVAKDNYPDIIHIGDVKDVLGFELPKIDLMIGGSPCTNFSFAGKRQGMSTKCKEEILDLDHYLQLKCSGFEFEGQSYLFWEYMRLLKEVNPTYFLLENVMMVDKWKKVLSEAIGVEPIMINSSLVSAQNRRRLYWTNIKGIEQPQDRGILLKDILETGDLTDYSHSQKGITYMDRPVADGRTHWDFGYIHDSDKDKAKCLVANLRKGLPYNMMIDRRPCTPREFDKTAICHHAADADDINGHDCLKRVYAGSGKSPTVNACTGGNREPKVLCGAVRGRKDPGDENYTQKLELRDDEKTNSLTTVQKDNVVCERPASIVGRRLNEEGKRDDYNMDVPITQCLETAEDPDKSRCLTTVTKDTVVSSLPPGRYPNVYTTLDDEVHYRKLTPRECERLQTVPDGYTDAVSNSQRYKMLGNGWTVDVISHIFKHMYPFL